MLNVHEHALLQQRLDKKTLKGKKWISYYSMYIQPSSSSCEPDVVLCSVSVIPLQNRGCSVCISFIRLGHHNG